MTLLATSGNTTSRFPTKEQVEMAGGQRRDAVTICALLGCSVDLLSGPTMAVLRLGIGSILGY